MSYIQSTMVLVVSVKGLWFISITMKRSTTKTQEYRCIRRKMTILFKTQTVKHTSSFVLFTPFFTFHCLSEYNKWNSSCFTMIVLFTITVLLLCLSFSQIPYPRLELLLKPLVLTPISHRLQFLPPFILVLKPNDCK